MAEVLMMLSSLLLLSVGAHASHVVRTQGDSFTLKIRSKTFCVISKLTPGGEPLLWNSSKPSSRNATGPEDIGSQIPGAEGLWIDAVEIASLSKSDSGWYKKTGWVNSSKPVHEEFSLTVCGARRPDLRLMVISRSPSELLCSGAGSNATVRWFKRRPYSDMETCWIHGALIAVEDLREERHLVAVNGSALRVSSFSRGDAYVCLLLDGRDCASTQTLKLDVKAEYVYQTEGETALLPCVDEANRSALWETPDGIRRLFAGNGGVAEKGNYSLLISSLKLNHTGEYFCSTSAYIQHYVLLVCPDSPPLQEVFFDGGEATLRCHSNLFSGGDSVAWFRRTTRHQGVIWDSSFGAEKLPADLEQRARVTRLPNASLVLSNLSRPDSGEYWCHAVHHSTKCHCKSTSRVILTCREHVVPLYFFVTWASLMACGLVVMICLVATVFKKHKCGRDLHTQSDTNTQL